MREAEGRVREGPLDEGHGSDLVWGEVERSPQLHDCLLELFIVRKE